ncbi:AAA domain-containing protein [Actinopolymorpha cephalotaxi]|uniref:AAA domain-containing protein n=1 Tax=Actinopolymorpha cephalotaxi TaxID=504797 RepID=A0A1I2YJ76_9ACTN|nr:AAA family ATPase [Actinopolymorpha cephalotaxi]NYH86945.1 chloramphenicol 3-O-phosphotransferase [Actinopolymorpha cephalotaxi]SFH25577.1 AAA domain-containing protein [Actinopolymorpha cephalotaxi]
MTAGTLVEFGGLPGTGKSTLARHLADHSGAVWLRIDEIENAMRRNGLSAYARHLVIETACPDTVEHRRRVESRRCDLPGWSYPDWEEVRRTARHYQPRTDVRMVVDTTRPAEICRREITLHLAAALRTVR